jgi:fatty acid desaturase
MPVVAVGTAYAPFIVICQGRYGLNYQIEHHLFPSMPRPNLRHAQPTVRTFCQRTGVAYRETGVISSYPQALGHLGAVGRSPLPDPAG